MRPIGEFLSTLIFSCLRATCHMHNTSNSNSAVACVYVRSCELSSLTHVRTYIRIGRSERPRVVLERNCRSLCAEFGTISQLHRKNEHIHFTYVGITSRKHAGARHTLAPFIQPDFMYRDL